MDFLNTFHYQHSTDRAGLRDEPAGQLPGAPNYKGAKTSIFNNTESYEISSSHGGEYDN
jgi:hypothetical protein